MSCRAGHAQPDLKSLVEGYCFIKQLAELATDLRTFDQHGNFGIGYPRTRIEIHRAGPHQLAIHDNGFGMQAGTGRQIAGT